MEQIGEFWREYPSGKRRRHGVFICSCGNEFKADVTHVRRGQIRSCGCLRRKLATAQKTTHGMTNTPEYRTWGNMIKRCHNPNEPCFPRYGGKGIAVCEEWRNSFVAFYGYVGRKPTPKHTIDRIDSKRGYEPGNVRWATAAEQVRNRSNTVFVSVDGRDMCLKDYCEYVGLSYNTVRYRRNVLGWPLDKATQKNGRKTTSYI